jgi:hypothetical protein
MDSYHDRDHPVTLAAGAHRHFVGEFWLIPWVKRYCPHRIVILASLKAA